MEKIEKAKKDVENLIMLDDIESLYLLGFDVYSPIYRMSNENLSRVKRNLDIKSKEVLTICGSGDQYLTFLLAGAKSVDVFDINKLTEYYLILKITAILVLSLEDFKKFFIGLNSIFFFSERIYVKFRDFLPEHVKLFWDTLYQERVHLLYLQRNGLFYPDLIFEEDIPYLNLFAYRKLSKLLEKSNLPDFYSCDISKISETIDKPYDMIYLSNICDYYESQNSFEEWIDLLKKISEKLLNEKGNIIDFRFVTSLRRIELLKEYYSKIRVVDGFSCPSKDAIYVYKSK